MTHAEIEPEVRDGSVVRDAAAHCRLFDLVDLPNNRAPSRAGAGRQKPTPSRGDDRESPVGYDWAVLAGSDSGSPWPGRTPGTPA